MCILDIVALDLECAMDGGQETLKALTYQVIRIILHNLWI